MTNENLTPSNSNRTVRADNLIAVASGKGGVGKTWFSITLAHALAKQNKKILLFDGDLGLANVDVQLGLMPQHDLRHVIEGKLSMQRIIQHHAGTGLDIIAGQSGAASLANLPIEQVIELRDQLLPLCPQYDRVIIDLGAGIDRTVRILSGAASRVLVVVNEEPTSLTDAYAFIKLTHMAGLADAVQIVVNNVDQKADGERVYQTISKACQNFLKIRPPLAGIIRNDKKVPESIRHQTPLLTRYPNSTAAFEIEIIANYLLGSMTVTAPLAAG
ncbi:MAG TPA: MinD/ParA family protein [Alphaproteobacteria bacterium]